MKSISRRIVPFFLMVFLTTFLMTMTGGVFFISQEPPTALAQNYQTTITVTSTDDSDVSKSHTCYTTPGVGQTAFPGECTLRRAINEASSLPDGSRPVLIDFNIPTSDPGYNADLKIWKIVLNTAKPRGDELPMIEGGQVTIDGTTQPGGREEGPKIFVTANDLETVASPSLRLRLGEQVSDDGYVARGLGLQGFGISMTGSDNLVENNWLGLTDDGTKVWFYRGDNPRFVTRTRNANGDYITTPVQHAAYWFEGDPEKGNGAEIVDAVAGGSNNTISNNRLAGTNGIAIAIRSTGSRVIGNYVGTRADGTVPAVAAHRKCKPNALYYNWFGGSGIKLTSDAKNTLVQNNVIVAMLKYSKDVLNTPIDALGVGGNNNQIEQNTIGVDASGNEVGVCGEGLDLSGKNQVVRNNTLVDTRLGAIGIYGTANTLDSIHLQNTTTKKSHLGHSITFPSNPFFGQSVPSVYKEFNSATVTSIEGTAVSGTAGADSPCAGCGIELYSDNTDQYIEALELLGSATAGADGTWTATLSRTLETGEGLRAATTTAQDVQINGIAAPTTAKLSALYGPTGVMTPTTPTTPTTSAIEPPPDFPTLQARPVPPMPTHTYTTELVVDTTADDGPDKASRCSGNTRCTLRYAINEVRTLRQSGADYPIRIAFNIPTSDPGFDSATQTWKIQMSSNETTRVEGGNVAIDGTTQPGGRDNGPKIIISDEYNLVMDKGDNIVRGLAFQEVGLTINGSYNFVEENWFGLSADGTSIYLVDNDPSRDNNAWLQDGTESSVGTPAIENVYRNNIFVGSISPAITVRGNSSWVVGNRVGMLADGTVPPNLPADWCEQGSWYGGAGITISGGAGNQIGGPEEADRNILAGLNYPTSQTAVPPNAIELKGQGGNLVLNNMIGRDAGGTEVGVCGEAVRISDDFSIVRDTTIISPGITAFGQVSARLGGNRITFANNTLRGTPKAMEYSEALKKELDLAFFNPARVTSIAETSVEGRSGDDYVDPITGKVVKGFCPHCTIEIYADDDDTHPEALELLATTTSDAEGKWSATLSRRLTNSEGIRTLSTSGDYGRGIKAYEAGTSSHLSQFYRETFASNYASGAPGSVFIFTASGFSASGAADIALKEPGTETYRHLATLSLDENGNLVFLFVTSSSAEPGDYTIRITVQLETATLADVLEMEETITLDEGEPQRTDEPAETVPIIKTESEVPVYLPLVVR